jgi:hypothetical protein
MGRNWCDAEESERALLNHRKFPELVLFYRALHLHRKALEILAQLSRTSQPSSPLHGPRATVQYLMGLGSPGGGGVGGSGLTSSLMTNNPSSSAGQHQQQHQHQQHQQQQQQQQQQHALTPTARSELVRVFSVWVLEENPEEGMRVFVEGDPRDPLVPPRDAYPHLRKHAPGQCVRYLEHVVHGLKEQDPFFHDELIFMYVDAIKALMAERAREGRADAGGEETGLRAKLLALLTSSSSYTPESMLSRFPQDSLLEERAVLLSRVGLHGKALEIMAR